MSNEHPITPPPELVERLRSKAPHGIRDAGVTRELHLITAAYRAGADHQFAECFQWVESHVSTNRARLLRAALRPKPPSLKELALEALDEEHADMQIQNYKLIRSVLESLPD